MACPFFYPTERLEEDRWSNPPHLPLGDPYDGECRASAEACRPGDEQLKQLCNFGYARGRCPRFRDAQEVDAARFAVSRDDMGAVLIAFVQERDHRPHGHGRLEYQTAAGSFTASHADPNVQQQAHAYLRAYLRRKAGRPPAHAAAVASSA